MQQNFIKILFIKKSWAPNESCKKTMTMKPKKRSNMLWKEEIIIQEATGTLSDDELDNDIEDEEEEEMRYA